MTDHRSEVRERKRLLAAVERYNKTHDYELTRDVDNYKAQACWDDAIRRAQAALAACEQPVVKEVVDEKKAQS